MKSIIYAIIGLIMYGLQNAIIDVKLKEFSVLSLLVGFYLVLLPLGLLLFAYQWFFGEKMVLPPREAMYLVAAVAAMFFVADFFYVAAFTNGGNAIAITILAALVPVVVAITKFVWVREVPTAYHVVGFTFALAAVACVALGNMKEGKTVEESIEPQHRVTTG